MLIFIKKFLNKIFFINDCKAFFNLIVSDKKHVLGWKIHAVHTKQWALCSKHPVQSAKDYQGRKHQVVWAERK